MASLRTYYPLVHRKAVSKASLPANIPSSVIPPRKPVPKPQPQLEVGKIQQQNHGDQPHVLQSSTSEDDRDANNGIPDRDRPVALFSLDDLLDGQSLTFPDEDEDRVAGTRSSTLDLSDFIERHREYTLRLLTQNERKPEQSSISSPFKSSDSLPCEAFYTDDISQHDSLFDPLDSLNAKPERTTNLFPTTTPRPPSPQPPSSDDVFASTSTHPSSSYDKVISRSVQAEEERNSFEQILLQARVLEEAQEQSRERSDQHSNPLSTIDLLMPHGEVAMKSGMLSGKINQMKQFLKDGKAKDFALKVEHMLVDGRTRYLAKKSEWLAVMEK